MSFDDMGKRGDGGVAAGILPYSPVQYCILAAGTAVAWVYVIELNITIFMTFKRRSGLYFWSLLISSWGISLHALGFILKFLVGVNWVLACTVVDVGWVAMVTGQAFVLYSRLHLIVRNQRTLRFVLCMILFDAAAFHIPTIITFFGSNSAHGADWTAKFNIVERIQLAGFCLQEIIISAIYVWSTTRLLGSIYHHLSRKVMTELIIINCIAIGMDIALICLEYTNQYIGEASMKPMIYAIKLKLEFIVLNQLMGLAKGSLTEGNRWTGGAHGNELKDRAQASNDLEARQSKLNTLSSAKGRRDSAVPKSNRTFDEQKGILKTQHTEVYSQPAADFSGQERAAVSSTTPAFSNAQQMHPNPTDMGGVHIPGRSANSRAGNHGRGPSPSESETQIFRNSSETEKESR